MWVCLCNGINTKSILDAKEKGASTAKDVFAQKGCRVGCGKCCSEIKNLLTKK